MEGRDKKYGKSFSWDKIDQTFKNITMGHIYRPVLVSCLLLISVALSSQTHNWTIDPQDYESDCEVNAVVFMGSDEVTTGTLGAFVGNTCRGFADGIFFPGTGRTIFSVRCYSNEPENPETFTFRYFDPAGGSYYNIIETVVFVSDGQLGNARNPLLFHRCDPVALLSGPLNGRMCAVSGSTAFSVTAGGTSPYTYQWQYNTGTEWVSTTNGIPAGAVYSGSNTATLNVSGITSAGQYQYRCHISNCHEWSSITSNSATLTVDPLPGAAGTISGLTTVCQGQSAVTYTVPVITNATSYVWSLPPGATGSSTTNSITVNYGLSATSGNISVRGHNDCGDGSVSVLSVTVSPLPAAPGPVTGPATVCQGQTSVSYHVPEIANATSYVWSYSGTGAVITGTGNSVTIDFLTNATSGNLTVRGLNSCGQGAVSAGFAITVNPLPAAAGTIEGTASVCQGQTSVTYRVAAIVNATSYNWSYSGTGAAINGTGNTVTIDFATNATSGNLSVRGVNNCGTGAVSANFAVTVNPLPAAAGSIQGTANVCQGQQAVEYSVPPIANATAYTWSYSGTGAAINGTGPSVTIDFGPSAVSGNLTVRGVNACGSGIASANYPVTVNPLPGAAGTISGTAAVCQGQSGVSYTVPAIPNATSYVWTLPAGASGTSTTNSITVNYSASALSGNITVRGRNACGDGIMSSLAVTVNPLPGAAGTISGAAAVCQGHSGVSYTVPAIPNATSYVWTLPTGASGTSTTNSITVNYSTSALSGNITVRGRNACGDGTVSTMAVTVNPLPGTAGTISGAAAVCQGQSGVSYTVPAIPNATSYVWTLPAGASGTSTTNSITVNYSTSALSGNITVRGRNACGDGSASVLAVTLNPLPSAITGITMLTAGSTMSLASSPAGGTWSSSVPAVATVNSSTGLVRGVSPGNTVITYRLPTGCSVSAGIDVLPAGWSVIPANFNYEGRITAAVFPENEVSEPGYLAAFAGDECRGIARSVYYAAGGSHIYTIACYSNTRDGDILVFRHFNPAGGNVQNMDRSVDFEPGMIVGSQSSPFRMGRGVDYEMHLPVGWTWLSVNTILDNMTLNFILSTVSAPGDYIKDQTGSATYYELYGWFGTINSLDPTKLYKIRSHNIADFGFSGRPVDVTATPISLSSGWNWIGYLPTESMSVNMALGSLSPENGDYIKDQTNSSIYYSNFNTWFGNLINMSPYSGYMLRLTNPGTLLYPRSGSKGAENIVMNEGIRFNHNEFEFSGSLTAKVLVDGIERDSENDLLYAYVKNETRGIANGKYFKPADSWLYTLMIHSNIEEGETVGFKYFDSENNKYYGCDQTIIFSSDMIVADALKPLELNFSSSDISDNFAGKLKLKIYPNPFSHELNIGYDLAGSSHVRITILDVHGRVIRTLADQAQKAGSYQFTWNSGLVSSGLYFIKFEADHRYIIQKVILR
jgi:hypothetical protein